MRIIFRDPEGKYIKKYPEYVRKFNGFLGRASTDIDYKNLYYVGEDCELNFYANNIVEIIPAMMKNRLVISLD